MSPLIDWWNQQVANYDIDAYLTTKTEEWFTEIMHHLGHSTPPVMEEFATPEGDIIPQWLVDLFNIARAHTVRNETPPLALPPRPEGSYQADMISLLAAGYQEVSQDNNNVTLEMHEEEPEGGEEEEEEEE
ncbi:hypothetical protein LTR43_010186, partial [Exophiala xenobiotica]